MLKFTLLYPICMMLPRYCFPLVILCLLFCLISGPAWGAGQDGFRRDDAFDVSQGNQVLGGSDVYSDANSTFDLRDIFGGEFGTYAGEPDCIFATAVPPDS